MCMAVMEVVALVMSGFWALRAGLLFFPQFRRLLRGMGDSAVDCGVRLNPALLPRKHSLHRSTRWGLFLIFALPLAFEVLCGVALVRSTFLALQGLYRRGRGRGK